MKVILISDTHYGYNHKTDAKHEKFWRKLKEIIEVEKVRFLIWAGDLASNKQHQLYRTLQHMRQHVSLPVALARGNHDFWDVRDLSDPISGCRSFDELQILHKRWFSEFNIHHLEDGPIVFDDILVCGWDGWYAMPPNTNDAANMFRDVNGVSMHEFMSSRAHKKLEAVLSFDTSAYRKVVAVTHHNPYVVDAGYEEYAASPRFLPLIKEFADVLCCGHNHLRREDVEDGCLILNCGSDYNQPRFILFEL